MVLYEDLKDAIEGNDFVKAFVHWVTAQTIAPVCYSFAAAIQALATVAPDELLVPYYGGRADAGSLYSVLVGPPGVAKKTTVVNLMCDLLDSVNPQVILPHPDSPEGFAAALEERPHGVLAYTELSELLAKSARGRNEPLRALLTMAWDGRPISRKYSQRAIYVEKPRLCLFGGITPSTLGRYTSEVDWTGGLLSRMAFWAGPSEHKDFGWEVTPGVGNDKLFQWMSNLLRIELTQHPCYAPAGYDPVAFASFNAWTARLTELAEQSDTPDWLRGTLGRTPNFAVKVAALLDWISGRARQAGWVISAESMQAGIVYAEGQLNTTRWIIENTVGDVFERQRKEMLTLIRKAYPSPVLEAQLHRKLKAPPRRVGEIVVALTEAGYITVETAGAAKALRAVMVEEMVAHDAAKLRVIEDAQAVRAASAKLSAAGVPDDLDEILNEGPPPAPAAAVVPPLVDDIDDYGFESHD